MLENAAWSIGKRSTLRLPSQRAALSNLTAVVGKLSLNFCNYLYFNEGTFGQILRCNGTPGREGSREEFGIDLIHCSKVGNVTEEDCRLNHTIEVCSCLAKDGLNIGQRLPSLFLNAAFDKCSSCWINWKLPTCIDEAIRHDGLAVRPNRSWSLAG